MTRWYSLGTADAGIFTSAPLIFTYEKRFAAPPDRVWESLESDESLSAWSSAVKELTWLTPRPFGVGTVREVVLASGIARVHEHFFRWDEGRGYSFYVTEATAPGLSRMAEDYVVVPDEDGTIFRWTVAVEPKGPLTLPFKVLGPGLKAAFGKVASDGERYFART
jgi:hypothetical protein